MSKAALVTGAGKRIGRAIAMMLARDGFSVAVHYHRSREDAESLVAAIESAGGRAAAVPANLADEAETGSLVDRAALLVGPLVALVNNASTFEYDTPETATRETWDLHMEANLRAPFVLTQQFARRLPEGVEGAVVNVLDQRVWNLSPHYTTYTVSKAGLWALTQSLALALAPRIRVNAVGPGPTLPSTRQTPEQFAAQCESMPLRRGATPEDVCDAVRYLLSARAVTGQMIAVDGGQHLGWATPTSDSSPD
ncbi:SDR family oxidoreductase [Polyangium sp. 15x6]|uniref:SDR family oxidoreductase n=1 Tax=Polyangium sp. 15x6 TaxID=3042687 RepID=UPI00249CE69C|nr:SDR family oxidoreductase [Polyangium sp. 15x6]MDI3287498.1 SDR family oxidoreductase [Polyangium sp. 15x6]